MISRLIRFALCIVAIASNQFVIETALATIPVENAQQLVRQLGASSYQEREQAFKMLQRIGIEGKPAVEQGLKSADLEIRFRCEILLDLISKAEQEQRLLRFISCGIQPGEKPFESWEEFRRIVGDDFESRALFASIYDDDPAFLRLVGEGAGRALTSFQARLNEFVEKVNWQETLFGSIDILRPEAIVLLQQANVIFVLQQSDSLSGLDSDLLGGVYKLGTRFDCYSIVESKIRAAVLSWFEAQMTPGELLDSNVLDDLTSLSTNVGMLNDFEDAIRPLALEAIERVVNTSWQDRKNRSEAYALIRLADDIALPEVIPVALLVAKATEARSSTQKRLRTRAVNLVGKYGTEVSIEQLKPLLEDRTEIYGFGQIGIDGVGYTSYLGDEVLAAMIHLSGDELAEYGFGRPVLPNPTYEDRLVYGWGFFGTSAEETEQFRQQAITKWKTRRIEESNAKRADDD